MSSTWRTRVQGWPAAHMKLSPLLTAQLPEGHFYPDLAVFGENSR